MIKINDCLWLVAASLLVAGCITQNEAEPQQVENPGGASAALLVSADAEREQSSMALDEPEGRLALQQALAQVLMKNPALEAYSHSMRASEAEILQSRVFPNPELEFEVENLDRDGDGFDYAEPSVKLGQLIELGGKRGARIEKAHAVRDLSMLEFECRRLHLFSKTAQSFAEVICAQQGYELAESLMTVAEQTSHTVIERVNAGKESPVHKAKALAELEMARLEFTDAQSTLMVKRHNLSAMWGSSNPLFNSAAGNFDIIQGDLPTLDALRIQLESNPLIAAADANIRIHEAILSGEKAEQIPDVNVSAGVKHFEEDDTQALIVGMAFPLPLFNRNKGGISAANHKLAKSQAEKRSVQVDLSNRLTAAYSGLVAAHKRVLVLQNNVVPAMEGAYDAAHRGYKEGKFDLLDVLDTQRGLFKTKARVIDAMLEYHTALSRIEELIGKSLSKFNEEEK